MTADLPSDWTLPPAAFGPGLPREASWDPWVRTLPRLAADLIDEWELRPDSWRTGATARASSAADVPVRHGECAVVLPVRTPDGTPAALKLGWPHPESEHEHLALRRWAGAGAVALLRADPHRGALLLERAGPAPLTSAPDLESCAVVAGLYRDLHVPALPQLTRLSGCAADWAARLLALPRDAPVPRRLVEQAAALARDLSTDPATDGTLVHTDLHDENVLESARGWLAIDPKPLSGDPAYEPAPLLWNRWAEVVASGDVRRHVLRRTDVLLDVAGLDPHRVRDWVVVRELVNVLWCLEAIHARGERPDEGARAWITRAVTIAKAVQS